LGFVLVF